MPTLISREKNSTELPQQKRGLIRRLSSIPTPIIFLVSIVVALLLLWQQGSLRDVVSIAREANGWLVIAAFLLYVIGLALLCVRWHLLVRMISGTSSLPDASEAFLTSVVVNYAAPVGLAVPTRAALTKRALGLTAAETGAVAVWEVVLDVLVLLFGSVLWLGVSRYALTSFLDSLRHEWMAVVVVIGGAVIALAVVLLILRQKSQWWFRIRFLAKNTALYPRQRPREATYSAASSLVYWVAQGLVLWLLLVAMTDSAGLGLTLGLISIPILVGMLSPVPGGAGIREALMLGIARVHGAETGPVLLAAITYRVALFAAIPVLYLLVRVWIRRRGGMEKYDA